MIKSVASKILWLIPLAWAPGACSTAIGLRCAPTGGGPPPVPALRSMLALNAKYARRVRNVASRAS